MRMLLAFRRYAHDNIMLGFKSPYEVRQINSRNMHIPNVHGLNIPATIPGIELLHYVHSIIMFSSVAVTLHSLSQHNIDESRFLVYITFVCTLNIYVNCKHTVFARSNTAIVGSNPTAAWMFVCVCSVCVFSVST
jgi:hypothetical protein